MAKSLPGHMGNINLRGKKGKLLSCGCCFIQNKKSQLEKSRITKELTLIKSTK